MNVEDKIKRAAIIVIGSVPINWFQNTNNALTNAYNNMPELAPSYPVPFTTFLLYIVRKHGITNKILWASSVIDCIPTFVATYPEMKEIARTTTELDAANMQAEFEAFGSLENCIVKPKLAISPIYRYLVAQDTNMDILLTEDDRLKAINQLRENPYFYLEYPEYQNLMPITWEEL
jgi:hypothetical protein